MTVCLNSGVSLSSCCNGVGQSVRQLHIASLQFPHQLHVMISGNAERRAVFNHFHDQAQHVWNLGSAVNKITNENRSASIWRSDTWCRRSFVDLVTELNEQSTQLLVATVHVPDDVERSVLVLQIIPKRLSHDRDRGDLFWTGQHEDMTKAFAFKSRSERRSCCDWFLTTCGPNCRSGRL